MMKKLLLLLGIGLMNLVACQKNETAFSEEVLSQKVYSENGDEKTLKEVLDAYKGQKVMLDVWASWCSDCVKSMPKIKKFQETYPNVAFVFLSVDDKEKAWKNGIEKYVNKFKLTGEQYFFATGWKKSNNNNAFINFVGLDWIPRYLLVDENGAIKVFYARSIEDSKLSEAVKEVAKD